MELDPRFSGPDFRQTFSMQGGFLEDILKERKAWKTIPDDNFKKWPNRLSN